ncbi:Na(+)/H(+) antiporter subunit F1 [Paenibacillus lemnae]|uniref:Na(+)/H(+) antiporter subunit F1 n=1 Tax=Paenibacillus lemnae TaxID=1330551 RepID=A0A848MDI3_PAELE|nr:Na(+)/H(+) antiporter subunit F1 [Paenibacillus lemnae]NMO98210.1 Na(+)/H(+) antiporter subunit F1 [Paenibacillus lemnae]
MMDMMLMLSLALLSLGILGSVYRLIKGPSMNDRIIALDTIGVILLSIVAVLSMLLRTFAYLDIILLIGILTFIGTTALARYIERGDVIERTND